MLSLLAAQHYSVYGQRVALIDLDISQQSQMKSFRDTAAQHGEISGPYDATFGEDPFWQVSPDGVDEFGRRKSAALYGGLNLIGQTGLAVTEFRWDEIKNGQSVHIREARSFWNALRDQFALVIVDTPAFDRADTALTIIPEADKTVIVCASDTAKDPAQKALSDRIEAANGRCAGLVVNEGPARAHSQLA
jgi:Mrp family chromosome partitioning ATPase